jgi:hypothetical protein
MKRVTHTNRLSAFGIIVILILCGFEAPKGSSCLPASTSAADTSFGSGNFGAWESDEFGAPVYHYTCNQLEDPIAITRVNPVWISPTNHMHQIGNDRLIGVVSNYGYVQVRQDEGSPKFLNDFDPERGMYGGGIGFLTDGENYISTMYPGNAASFERYFGTGYFRKKVAGHGYEVNQVIFAPFGDDPVILSQVTVTNLRTDSAHVRWIEYWDNHTYQFSFRSFLYSIISPAKGNAPERRREFSTHFSHAVEEFNDGHGVMDRTTFEGFSDEDEKEWTSLQFILSTVAKDALGGKIELPVEESKLEDQTLPATFLVSLDDMPAGWSTNSGTFFGKGGIDAPDDLNAGFTAGSDEPGKGDALMIERDLTLGPGEEKTIYFIYGYQEKGVDAGQLISKYRTTRKDQLSETVSAWQKNRISFKVENEPWVDRELLWHNYYLRSNLTYDDFFKNKILSQGHVYQYVFGFQGAARDPLQHALPLIYSDPEVVKEIIRYTCKEVMLDGSIPYGIVGSGVIMPSAYLPSDTELWLLWLTSEYVLATRDAGFLDEKVITYPIYRDDLPKRSIKEILTICYDHLINTTGTGKHGLMRLSNGDWNDGAVMGFVPNDQVEQVRIQGESVLNASFASYVLDLYGTFLSYLGEEDQAKASERLAEDQKNAVRKQWTGAWFRRQWLTDSLGWIGEDIMWLEPQPWAIIGGACTEEQTGVLVHSINEKMRDPSPIGAMLLSEEIESMEVPAGTLTNGGVWPSINGTLVWALAGVDKALGWDEWKKNSLACHAEAYPDVWYGIWSGPDSYNSILSKEPGHTYVSPENEDNSVLSGINWTDFPVMNMHPHAWPLYDVTKLLGLEFTPDGFRVNPSFPVDYSFDSPLISLKKEGDHLGGTYNPVVPGEWTITVSGLDISGYSKLVVNEAAADLNVNDDGELILRGSSTRERPLTWELEK